MQAYTDDRRLHHIIDPASGISPGDLSSASVLAPNACDADALATAMLVMGAGAGLSLIERLPDTEALVISKDGSMRHSANFPI
jgi:thiamine biosynthesis lipoprotein